MSLTSISGYAEEAPALLVRYEARDFAEVHRSILHLLPPTPARVLDIGAGTGRDAAAHAALGYRVVAAEPVAAMREGGQALHPSPAIRWVADELPDLADVRALGERFDLIMLTAVWMHLDAGERAAGMASLAGLLADEGVLAFSLRHGPVPAGRRMFEVTADETIALAAEHGLDCVLNVRDPSLDGPNIVAGVDWTRLVFRRV